GPLFLTDISVANVVIAVGQLHIFFCFFLGGCRCFSGFFILLQPVLSIPGIVPRPDLVGLFFVGGFVCFLLLYIILSCIQFVPLFTLFSALCCCVVLYKKQTTKQD